MGDKKGIDAKKLKNAKVKSSISVTSLNTHGSSKATDGSYNCGECRVDIKDSEKNIECSACRQYVHRVCADLDKDEFRILSKGNQGILWNCKACLTSKGNEVKKLLRLEERVDKMMELLTSKFENLEETLINKIEGKMTTKIEEKVKEVEERLTSQIKERLEETQEREKRKCNLVLWNVPESIKENSEEKRQEDTRKVEEIFKNIVEIDQGEVENPVRIGKVGDLPRLLRVSLKSEDKKNAILRNARKLNQGKRDQKSRIYINPDLTPLERQKEKELRDQLKARRDGGEEGIAIRFGKIIKVHKPDRPDTRRDVPWAPRQEAGHQTEQSPSDEETSAMTIG